MVENNSNIYHQGKCIVSGCNNVQNLQGNHRVSGKKRYGTICKKHKQWPRKFLKNYCESSRCEWKGTFEKILDVDHIDGDKANILENNFRTLCANCHKIKSFEEKNELSQGNHEEVNLIRDEHQGSESQIKKIIRAICMTEGCMNLQSKHDNRNGVWRYKKYCRNCMRLRRLGYVKKDHCEYETCYHKGTFPFHILEVDHIDGNSKNNSTNNLQTLCANCHKIKTHFQHSNLH